jgi:cyclopropane-fatty-acyl-phospholipid synthase
MRSLAKSILLSRLEGLQHGHLEIVCPQETYSFGDASSDLRATVAVHDERFFTRALLGGDVAMGEAFMDGDWSTPDLVSVVRIAVRNLVAVENQTLLTWFQRVADRLLHLRNDNSIAGSSRNISYHYDLSNQFYQLFLDRNLVYSCGYFKSPQDDLGTAQIQKFDRICQKLRLSKNDHLLEIGTGWGGFAIHAALNYGCRVTTTTISRQQHDYAQKRIQESGLEGQITLLFEDYRKLQGRFDKIVSIEMFEAVGLKHYDEYFGACDRLLKPQGTMLLQTININERSFATYRKRCDWIQRYIFPGAELASIVEIQRSLARCTSLQMHDAEDIGLHYGPTLKAWRERFLARKDEVRALGFDDSFLRMWEYYLAYCEGAFRERYIGDFQLLLAKNTCRQPLYEEPFDPVAESAGKGSALNSASG